MQMKILGELPAHLVRRPSAPSPQGAKYPENAFPLCIFPAARPFGAILGALMYPSSISSGASPPTGNLGEGEARTAAACLAQCPAARLPTGGQQLSIAAPVKFGARPPLTFVGRAKTLRILSPPHLAPPAGPPAAHFCVRRKIKGRKLHHQSVVALSFPIRGHRNKEYACNQCNSAPPRPPVCRGISDARKRLRPFNMAPFPAAVLCGDGKYQ